MLLSGKWREESTLLLKDKTPLLRPTRNCLLLLMILTAAAVDVDAAVDAAGLLSQNSGGKTHGTHGEWTGTTLTTLTGTTTAFTTALKVESAISMTHPSGDTFQDGQWDNPETSVIHLTQAIKLNFNGGKTPGTHGE